MEVRFLGLPDVALLVPRRFVDNRGFFSETWSEREFRQNVADIGFVQDNHSKSTYRGTVRALHCQRPPADQGKLIRVVRGAVLDAVVDVRKGSPCYGRALTMRLDAAEGAQLWIPPGFLHGFCTLEDDTEVVYKVTAYYSPVHDTGVLWNDPHINIEWPVDPTKAIVSDKDRRLPLLCDLPELFVYRP